MHCEVFFYYLGLQLMPVCLTVLQTILFNHHEDIAVIGYLVNNTSQIPHTGDS